MRNIAKTVNLTVAALYHHFPNKNVLYLETVQYAFADKALLFSEAWKLESSAEKKLELCVSSLIQVLVSDSEFHRLIQRELLDENKERLKILADWKKEHEEPDVTTNHITKLLLNGLKGNEL